MIYNATMKNTLMPLLLGTLLFSYFPAQAEVLGKIAAVVEEDIILEQELDKEVATISQRIRAGNTPAPPEAVLRKQVLEKNDHG